MLRHQIINCPTSLGGREWVSSAGQYFCLDSRLFWTTVRCSNDAFGLAKFSRLDWNEFPQFRFFLWFSKRQRIYFNNVVRGIDYSFISELATRLLCKNRNGGQERQLSKGNCCQDLCSANRHQRIGSVTNPLNVSSYPCVHVWLYVYMYMYLCVQMYVISSLGLCFGSLLSPLFTFFLSSSNFLGLPSVPFIALVDCLNKRKIKKTWNNRTERLHYHPFIAGSTRDHDPAGDQQSGFGRTVGAALSKCHRRK